MAEGLEAWGEDADQELAEAAEAAEAAEETGDEDVMREAVEKSRDMDDDMRAGATKASDASAPLRPGGGAGRRRSE